MNVAIDITPIDEASTSKHAIRGAGFYIYHLKKAIVTYYLDGQITFTKKGDTISNNIDIIHYPYFDPFFLSLPLFFSRKVIITVHDLIPLIFREHFPVGVKGNIKWLIQKSKLQNADAIITDSQSSKKDIMNYSSIPEKNIHVVYLAAGEEFRKIEDINQLLQIKKKYHLPDKFILYVGDATWNKNLPRLIEAVLKTNIPFVMVGKALVGQEVDVKNLWNADLVKIQTLLANNTNVFRLGFVSTEDLVYLYNLATVFVMPSLYEGFGLPILEAMSCGCPVITSKEGSLKEVAGDAAYYVNPYDVNNIADGILCMYNDKKLQHAFSTKGLRRVKNFSWKKVAKETIQVYKSI